MEAFKYDLGDMAKDRVSGLQGIIISRSEHLFGCSRYWIQPRESKDGKPVDGCWLDEDAIEIVESGVIKPRQYRAVVAEASSASRVQKAGGPTNQPRSQTGPTTR